MVNWVVIKKKKDVFRYILLWLDKNYNIIYCVWELRYGRLMFVKWEKWIINLEKFRK